MKGGFLSQELFYLVYFVSLKVVTEKRMLRNDFVLAVGKLLKADTRKYSHNPTFPDKPSEKEKVSNCQWLLG